MNSKITIVNLSNVFFIIINVGNSQAELIRAYRDKLDEIPTKPSQRQVFLFYLMILEEVLATYFELKQ